MIVGKSRIHADVTCLVIHRWEVRPLVVNGTLSSWRAVNVLADTTVEQHATRCFSFQNLWMWAAANKSKKVGSVSECPAAKNGTVTYFGAWQRMYIYVYTVYAWGPAERWRSVDLQFEHEKKSSRPNVVPNWPGAAVARKHLKRRGMAAQTSSSSKSSMSPVLQVFCGSQVQVVTLVSTTSTSSTSSRIVYWEIPVQNLCL